MMYGHWWLMKIHCIFHFVVGGAVNVNYVFSLLLSSNFHFENRLKKTYIIIYIYIKHIAVCGCHFLQRFSSQICQRWILRPTIPQDWAKPQELHSPSNIRMGQNINWMHDVQNANEAKLFKVSLSLGIWYQLYHSLWSVCCNHRAIASFCCVFLSSIPWLKDWKPTI